VKTNIGKVAFNIAKGCKNYEYIDVETVIVWYSLKKKEERTSAFCLVKGEKLFRQSMSNKIRP
jgi:hypothetical protein